MVGILLLISFAGIGAICFTVGYEMAKTKYEKWIR